MRLVEENKKMAVAATSRINHPNGGVAPVALKLRVYLKMQRRARPRRRLTEESGSSTSSTTREWQCLQAAFHRISFHTA